MTLDDLNAHADLLEMLNKARSMLEAFRSALLSASSLDGMPRSPSADRDMMTSLAVKLSLLEEEVARYEKAVKKSEPEIAAFVNSIDDPRVSSIFYLRFLCGYGWAEVANTIGGSNSVDAVKSACYRYLRQQADE